jgi:DNA-binding beta-propeller fold protein YncE
MSLRHAGRAMYRKSNVAFCLPLVSVWLAMAGSAVANGRYLGPAALAATSDGTTVYAACSDARQVAWIDTSTGTVSRRVSVPGRPTGLVLSSDASRLFVTCDMPAGTIVVMNAQSGETLQAIPAGHRPLHPVLSAGGTRLYVCNQFDNDISVHATDTGEEIVRVPVVREPVAADLSPDDRHLVVANHLPNTRSDRAYDGDIGAVVTIVDTRSFATRNVRLRRGAHSLRDVCVSPDGRHALVTHLMGNFDMVPFRVDTGWINVNVVSVIDVAKGELIGTIGMDYYDLGVGNPWDISYSADGKNVCVALSGVHQLCVISEEELLGDFARRTMQPMMAVWPIYLSLGESLWKRIPLPGKGPRGLAVAGSKVFAAQYFSDSIAVFDLDSKPIDPSSAAQYVDVAYLGNSDVLSGSYSGGYSSSSSYSSPYSMGRPAYDSYEVGTIPLGPRPELTLERKGELLFHDATICYEHWQSCASCHPDARVDGLNWDLMNDDQGNPKNTKSMLLSHITPPSMATGVRATAEIAVRAGIEHILFSDRPEDEAVAIDAYLKSLEPVPSPRLVRGELSEAARRGHELFKRVSCDRCHPAPLYTDLKLHNVGTRARYDYHDRFDTPTLVEVWRTAPYLHDGRYVTVRELLVDGQHGLNGTQETQLSEQDIDDLVEFVLSL